MSKVPLVTREEIGLRIRKRRTSKGRPLEEVATAIGVETARLVRWEDGVYAPDLEQAQRLAQALGCTVHEFVGASEAAE